MDATLKDSGLEAEVLEPQSLSFRSDECLHKRIFFACCMLPSASLSQTVIDVDRESGCCRVAFDDSPSVWRST